MPQVVPEPATQRVGIPSPPPRVGLRTEGSAVEMTLPWSEDVPVTSQLVTYGLAMVLLAGIVGPFQAGEFHPYALIALIPPLLPLYCGVCYSFNRTTVTVMATGVDIQHGPLPYVFRGMTLPMEKLAKPLVKPHYQRDRYLQVRWHELKAGRRSLLQYWHRSETLDYVAEVIKQVRRQRLGLR